VPRRPAKALPTQVATPPADMGSRCRKNRRCRHHTGVVDARNARVIRAALVVDRRGVRNRAGVVETPQSATPLHSRSRHGDRPSLMVSSRATGRSSRIEYARSGCRRASPLVGQAPTTNASLDRARRPRRNEHDLGLEGDTSSCVRHAARSWLGLFEAARTALSAAVGLPVTFAKWCRELPALGTSFSLSWQPRSPSPYWSHFFAAEQRFWSEAGGRSSSPARRR
jgi:hypothetical protein